jgi:predicted secreted protein
VKIKECDIYDQPIYKLGLSLKDQLKDKSIALQRDMTLPASRGCPIHYAIQHVYIYQNNIAVFINSYTTGFEGPDMRYLGITGKYK